MSRTKPQKFSTIDLYYAAMDAYATYTPKGREVSIGRIIGNNSLGDSLSRQERQGNAPGALLARAIIHQQMTDPKSAKYPAAIEALTTAQQGIDYYFGFDPQGSGARNGISKDTLRLTATMRQAVQTEKARQIEEGVSAAIG